MKSNFISILLLIAVVALGTKLYFLQADYDALLTSLVDDTSDQEALYINDTFMGNHLTIFYEDKPFIALDSVIAQIDDQITLSNSGQRVYISLDTMAFKIENESVNTFVNENMSAINVPLIYKDEQAYLSLDTVCRLYQYDYIYFEDTGTYLIFNTDTTVKKAFIAKNTQQYKMTANSYVKYEKDGADTYGYVLGMQEDYQTVLSQSGNLVYIKGALNTSEIEIEKKSHYQPMGFDPQEKISLTWEAIERYSDNFKKQKTEFEKGMNVVSPTWFNLNVNGILINSADINYVRKAHEAGIRVWGLYKNNFDPKWTSDLLENTIDQDYSIAQLLFYSAFYELDGINFDFENIYLKDKERLATYVTKASQYLHEMNITVSIDMTRPGGSDQWSKVYDREAIGRAVDYICLMAYDEYWGSSPVSGPVASLPWTEESITMSLESIPKEKLVLGIPLYMRVWEETKKSNGTYVKTGSRAITMNGFDNLRTQQTLEIEWDEASEQNYASYIQSGKRYRVWIEDAVSIRARLNLADTYGLPGIATWRRGYGSETSDALFDEWLGQRE